VNRVFFTGNGVLSTGKGFTNGFLMWEEEDPPLLWRHRLIETV
jgi:hypothetical protein